jgi:hypothetical protein
MKSDIAREKSEAVLKLIAAKAAEELESEYDEMEDAFGEEELPTYVDAGFQKVFATFVTDEKRKTRQRARKSILKVAVVVFAILGVSFTGLVVSVEAFRYKVFDLLFSREAGYNVVIPYEEAEGETLTQDWQGYYFPEYVPDGYCPTESNKTDAGLLYIHFVDDGGQNAINFQQSPLDLYTFLMDNEGGESEQIDIEGETGFWNKHDDTFTLLWMRGETGFVITTNDLSVEEVVKIAESVTYRK